MELSKSNELFRDAYPALMYQVRATYNPHLSSNFTVSYPYQILWSYSCIFCKSENKILESIYAHLEGYNDCRYCKINTKGMCRRKDSFMLINEVMRKQFKYGLNPQVDPLRLSLGSTVKINWKCIDHTSCKLHIWKTEVSKRYNGACGCSWCSHIMNCCPCDSIVKQASKELLEVLLLEFDPKLNPGYSLDSLSMSSGIRLTWKCSKHKSCKEHIWEDSVHHRTMDRAGCFWCNKYRICKCHSAINLHPRIMEYFVQELNPGFDIWKCPPSSACVVIWKCPKHITCHKHIWRMPMASMTRNYSGCPMCRNHPPCICSSIATTHSYLLEEFCQDLNPDIDITKLSKGTLTKINWKCKERGCVWRADISKRIYYDTGCPNCAGSKLERYTEDYLKKIGVSYSQHYISPEAVNPLTGKRFRFDFLVRLTDNIDTIVAILEIDGQQHFVDVKFNGKASKLEINKVRDQEKNKLCFERKISLLRISHSEIKHLAEHINRFLTEAWYNRKSNFVFHFCGIEYLEQNINDNIRGHIRFHKLANDDEIPLIEEI